eukprot:5332968-Prorocentrum_lima.AAC.1
MTTNPKGSPKGVKGVKPRVEARGRVKDKARASQISLVHLLLKAMRNMKNNNTMNQNGIHKKRPTMPQHKN